MRSKTTRVLEINELKAKLKAKDEECCFEGCNKKAEKSLGNNLTPNLNMCKEHFDLFQKHTDAREDYFKRKKDEEFKEMIKVEGIFDGIENALTYYYMELGLKKLIDIPFNTFEASLFIEEYLKTGNTSLKKLLSQLKEVELK